MAATTFESIVYEVADGVARLTLNRPEKLNAISGTMLREIHDALWEADDDTSVHCVVLAGATMANVMTMTFRSTFVPAHLLGRVTAASRIFVFGTVPFGAAPPLVVKTKALIVIVVPQFGVTLLADSWSAAGL